MKRQAKPLPKSYSIPALEKGMEILQFLAGCDEPLSQSQIAESLKRSISENFRILTCLERLGYLSRDPQSGAYSLTLKLFELAHQNPPTEQLISAAIGPMQRWAKAVGHSVHLSVMHDAEVLILAQALSAQHWSFSMKVGAAFSLAGSASGRLLMAFQTPDALRFLLQRISRDVENRQVFEDRLKSIRKRGYERVSDETFTGVTDLSCPVLNHSGKIVAAITAPVLLNRLERSEIPALLESLQAEARAITTAIGGREKEPSGNGEDQ